MLRGEWTELLSLHEWFGVELGWSERVLWHSTLAGAGLSLYVRLIGSPSGCLGETSILKNNNDWWRYFVVRARIYMVSLIYFIILFHRRTIFKMVVLEQSSEKWPFSVRHPLLATRLIEVLILIKLLQSALAAFNTHTNVIKITTPKMADISNITNSCYVSETIIVHIDSIWTSYWNFVLFIWTINYLQ